MILYQSLLLSTNDTYVCLLQQGLRPVGAARHHYKVKIKLFEPRVHIDTDTRVSDIVVTVYLCT